MFLSLIFTIGTMFFIYFLVGLYRVRWYNHIRLEHNLRIYAYLSSKTRDAGLEAKIANLSGDTFDVNRHMKEMDRLSNPDTYDKFLHTLDFESMLKFVNFWDYDINHYIVPETVENLKKLWLLDEKILDFYREKAKKVLSEDEI